MSKVYSGLKFFGFPDRLEALRKGRLAAPVHIRIKPINHCNHDCWYCSYRFSNLKLGEDMNLRDSIPEQKMFEIVEDVIEMGVKAITFSGGGEPMLYKALPRVVERLAEGGIRIGCLTNGSNLKGKMADAFAEHSTWVRVSLDGYDGPSYAKARNVAEDTFDRLMDNLRKFSARGSKCVLGAAFIIDQQNYNHVYDICSRLKDIGLNHVKVSSVIVSNSGAENNDYHAVIASSVREQIDRAMELVDDSFAIVDHYHTLDDRFEKHYHTCPNIQFTPVIGADSVVYTCHDKAYTKPGILGSIADRRFKEFWMSEENRLKVFSVDPARDCRHHCMDNRKIMTILDYLSTDPDHLAFT